MAPVQSNKKDADGGESSPTPTSFRTARQWIYPKTQCTTEIKRPQALVVRCGLSIRGLPGQLAADALVPNAKIAMPVGSLVPTGLMLMANNIIADIKYVSF
jgi:hypothetical protein